MSSKPRRPLSADDLHRLAFECLALPERRKRALFARLEGPRELFDASTDELRRLGLEDDAIRTVREHPLDEARGMLDELSALEARIVWPGHPGYPELLGEIADPPRILIVRGRLVRRVPRVAIVGSRRASEYGMTQARTFARGLARRGIVVVSGAARGVDGAALEGALAAEGDTVAVLGCGIDVAYPPEHADLLEEIARGGAVVTELPPGTPPLARNFPERNRILSGLCRAVLVIEAALRSGTLITARLAREQNREVLAIPHDLDQAGGEGPNDQIRAGATLVRDAEEVVEQLPRDVQDALEGPWDGEDEADAPPAGRTARRILAAMARLRPLPAGEIARRTGLDYAKLMTELALLELDGRVEKLPGLRYVRKEGR